MMAEFTSYATSHGLDVGPVGEASFSHAELQAERRTLSVLLKAHVGNRLYGRAAWYPVFHDIDRTFQEAMTLWPRSEEHTSEHQSRGHLVCRLLREKKNAIAHHAIRTAL